MTAKIRVGVVGTSWYSEMMHLANIKNHPGAELYAICGRNRTRLEELATKFSIPQVYTDYQAMIDRAKLHALVVATPDDLHYPISMAALDAGLHVLCEKPLAMNATQAKEMLDKAEAVGVKHMVFLTYRWMPFYKYIRQLIDQGYLGKWFFINAHHGGDYGREYMWRFDRQRANGILGDLGSHMIDLARWLVGEITQVSGQLNTFYDRPGPDGQPMDPANDAAIVTLRFANGAQGVIQVNAVAQMGEIGHQQHVVLCGEEGTLEVNFAVFGGAEIRGIRKEEKKFHKLEIPEALWETEDRNDFFKLTAGDRAFIDTILTDREPEPSFWDGYQVQVVIDAAKESHQQGKWIAIK